MFVNIDPEILKAANRWANLLPSREQQRYAFAYVDWYRNGAEGQQPERGRLTKDQAAAIRSHVDKMKLWEHVKNPRQHRHNAGCGRIFCFHGAFGKKSDAVEKEKKTPGAFVKGIHYGVGDYRYAVLTRRKETKNVPEAILGALGVTSVPAAIIEGLGFEAGSAVIDSALRARERRRKDREREEERKIDKRRRRSNPKPRMASPRAYVDSLTVHQIRKRLKALEGNQANYATKERARLTERLDLLRRRNPVAAALKLSSAHLRLRNQAHDWMVEHYQDYPSAQMLAQDASTKYGIAVSLVLPAAREIMRAKGNPRRGKYVRKFYGPATVATRQGFAAVIGQDDDDEEYQEATPQKRKRKRGSPRRKSQKKGNPLFTRGEKRKLKKKIKHSVKGAVRRLFGLGKRTQAPAPALHTHRGTARAGVREDVISALVNQGFSRQEAERMAPRPAPGEDFTSLFRRAFKRNPQLTESERRAALAYQDFHGADVDKVIKMENTIIESGNYFLVGEFFGYDLSRFPVAPFREVHPNVYAEGAGIKLAAGNIEKQDGNMVAHQLFVLGGNQNLDWALDKKFGITSATQLLDLGEVRNIWYIARKKQDDFKRYHYHHTFGEEGGSRPYLMYDRVHRKQFIVGGDYTVPLEGIRN